MSTSPYYTIDQAILSYGLNPYELALYNAIASHINHQSGLAWPSYTRLMETARMARGTVAKYLKSLEDRGLIQITRRYKRNSKERATNQYRLLNPHRSAGESGSSPAKEEVVYAVDEDDAPAKEEVVYVEDRGSSPADRGVVHAEDAGSSRAEPDVVHALDGNQPNLEPKDTKPAKMNQTGRTRRAALKSDSLSPDWHMFCLELSNICRMDFVANEAEIRRAARKLWQDGKGYTLSDLMTFRAWWPLHDWRGKRGEVPRLADVLREIRKAVESVGRNSKEDRYRSLMGKYADFIDS